MSLAIAYPRTAHPAIEERYGGWQTQLILGRYDSRFEWIIYDPDQPIGVALEGLKSAQVMVVSDPLLLPSQNLPLRLLAVLDNAPDAFAVIPVSNEAERQEQRRPPPSAYLTVRELQAVIEELEQQQPDLSWLTWDRTDPGIYLCRTSSLGGACRNLLARQVLEGQTVIVSATDYVHRWSLMRGGMRHDLFERTPDTAKSVLEFGCGEGVLGHAIKQRQGCRVVGIEIDPGAADVARSRLDHVHCGDVERGYSCD